MKTLWDALVEAGVQADPPHVTVVSEIANPVAACAVLSGKAFAEAVLNSDEFRLYIIDGLTERDLPAAVLCRLIDHGWGKPPERVEHTGKDGEPILTEIRRVIVKPTEAVAADDAVDTHASRKELTH